VVIFDLSIIIQVVLDAIHRAEYLEAIPERDKKDVSLCRFVLYGANFLTISASPSRVDETPFILYMTKGTVDASDLKRIAETVDKFFDGRAKIILQANFDS